MNAPHRVNLIMDNLEIDGSGSIDIVSGDFDYRLAFTLLENARVEPLLINGAHRGHGHTLNSFADALNRRVFNLREFTVVEALCKVFIRKTLNLVCFLLHTGT